MITSPVDRQVDPDLVVCMIWIDLAVDMKKKLGVTKEEDDEVNLTVSEVIELVIAGNEALQVEQDLQSLRKNSRIRIRVRRMDNNVVILVD